MGSKKDGNSTNTARSYSVKMKMIFTILPAVSEVGSLVDVTFVSVSVATASRHSKKVQIEPHMDRAL